MTDEIHSCSYYCMRPECILKQRNELRDLRFAAPQAVEAKRGELAKESEAGWLIEVMKGENSHWLTGHGKGTNDANEALRFARRRDADDFLEVFLSAKFGTETISIYKRRLSATQYSVTEHMWPIPAENFGPPASHTAPAVAVEPNTRLKKAMALLYGDGYASEHHETVESWYTDVTPSDREEYWADVVSEFIAEHQDYFVTPPLTAPAVTVSDLWQPIKTAPKDGRLILVGDLFMSDEGKLEQTLALAKWYSCFEWSGWIYDDDTLQYERPEGPTASFWFDVPPIPEDKP